MSEVIKIKSKGIKQGASNLPKDIDSRDLAEQERERFEQDTKQRKSLVVWMIVVVSIWLAFTACVVVTEIALFGKLSDVVMCALLTTTTANVIGLAMVVLKGLFQPKK